MSARCICFLLAAITLTACSSGETARYESYADAVRENAIDRGWIPTFVPKDATKIIETHDLDSNHVRVEFSFLPDESNQWLAKFVELAPVDRKKAIDTFSMPSWSDLGSQEKWRAFEICGEGGRGILFVALEKRRAHYIEPSNVGTLNCVSSSHG